MGARKGKEKNFYLTLEGAGKCRWRVVEQQPVLTHLRSTVSNCTETRMYFLKLSVPRLFQRFHGELLLPLSGRMRRWMRCPRQRTLARISAAPPLGSLPHFARCNLVSCGAVFCFSQKLEPENVYAKQALRARAGEVQTNGNDGNFRKASQRRKNATPQEFQEDARFFKKKETAPCNEQPTPGASRIPLVARLR